MRFTRKCRWNCQTSLMDYIREVHEYCEESTILQGIDVIYDRCFLTEQRRLGEQLGYPEL